MDCLHYDDASEYFVYRWCLSVRTLPYLVSCTPKCGTAVGFNIEYTDVLAYLLLLPVRLAGNAAGRWLMI